MLAKRTSPIISLAFAAILALPAAPARAQEASDPEQAAEKPAPAPEPTYWGPEAGLRIGYAMVEGGVTPGKDLRQVNGGPGHGMIPLWIDVGYRFGPYFFAGLYGSVGVAIQSVDDPDEGKTGSCPKNISCSGLDFRGGLNVQLHMLPKGSFDPWIGLGAGYEAYRVGIGGYLRSFQGWEFGNVSLGLRYNDSKYGSVGPFVAMSFGEFATAGGEDIKSHTTHRWTFFGLQGSVWTPL